MPASRACQISVTASERHRLKKLVRTQTAAQRDVLRARIVLLAAGGLSNNRIAARLGITVDTARKWRNRYAAAGRDGLADQPRSGRPPMFTPVQVAEVKALACQLPAEHQVPLSVWSCPELAREAITAGILEAVSSSTVRRWLGRGRDQTLAAPILDLPSGTRTSGPKPAACWTCMPASGTEPRWARTST
ncbi:MAG TPA: helix-turn-helix domain-containing protein [Pseudonocardiaceae bacterium]|nr:helix-turn-helix domain-containing protein [Pseudonocardiaceae bacterium]